MEFPALLFGEIHPHPVFELLAYFVGFQVFLQLRRRYDEPFSLDHRAKLIAVTIAGAFVGAKLLAWAVDPVDLWERRASLAAWVEGKTIVGGLLGGLLAVEMAKRRFGITRSTGDLYGIPLAAGIATGRVGCFLTGLSDRTYGTTTSAPWGVDFGDGMTRHPTQLYEIAFLVLLIAVLWRHQQAPRADGDQFKLFLLAYMAWRLAVGFIQPAPFALLGLSTIQWACLATLLVYARVVPRLARSVRGAFTAGRTPTAAGTTP